MKYLLLLTTQPPYFSSFYADGLEAAMAASNTGLNVKIIFIGFGCYQLVTSSSQEVGRKDLQKQLKLLSLYEISEFYCYEEPKEVQFNPVEEMQDIQHLSDTQFKDILNDAEQILVF